jgi:hypothetical protein
MWANRLASARPERFITLTCDTKRFPDPRAAYAAMKDALPKLVSVLRKLCGPLEYAAVWELHESGYPHLHLAQKGKYVPINLLKKVWNDLGIGFCCDIRNVDSHQRAARYVAKYMTKTVSDGKKALGITKVIQVSRHFFDKTGREATPHLPHVATAVYIRKHPSDILFYLIDKCHYALDLTRCDNYFRLYETPETVNPQGIEQALILLT